LKRNTGFYLYHFILFYFLLTGGHALAQMGQPSAANPNIPHADTSKTNTNKWRSPEPRLYYKKLNSEQTYVPDTGLHAFQRREFSQPWYRNTGNQGSATQNLLFTPEDRLGPSLGYHDYDIYRMLPDSLKFYNTNRPYSVFSYQLGSKLEQIASIMHTQNIKPNWNFAFTYRKMYSPGFFNLQNTNHDNTNLTTNYQSKDLHYKLNAAIIYNKEQQDENGGVLYEKQLDSSLYSDRKTMNVVFPADFTNPNRTRSAITNIQRDFTLLLQHSYTWGPTDTLYNADSTHITPKLTPRFGITHRLDFSSEKHQYKDRLPDSTRYTDFFQHAFITNGYSIQDSLLTYQQWTKVDNKISLNGFFGKSGNQLQFIAGIGNRIDNFVTNNTIGNNRDNILSNYLFGEIKKEALAPGQWFYKANTQFYLTGDDAGDFLLHAVAGKELKNNWGSFSAGFKQQLNSAPYSYQIFETQFDTITKSYNKESITQIYGLLESPKLRFTAGASNYLISNYIYINQNRQFDQYAKAFNITEIWARKTFRLGRLFLDNELVYQQTTAGAPVNVPTVLGRHQLSIESSLFKGALKLATGVMIQYHTSYYCAGYDPFFNRYYYQNSYYLSNQPEGSVYFNFRVKRFRAYIMCDQIQALFYHNNIAAPGYPMPDFMVRFGFTWVFIN